MESEAHHYCNQEVYKQLQEEFPQFSLEEIETIVMSPFYFTEKRMKIKDEKSILLGGFGRFYTTKKRQNIITQAQEWSKGDKSKPFVYDPSSEGKENGES